MSNLKKLGREIPYPKWAFNPRIRQCWITGQESTALDPSHRYANPKRRR